MEDEEEPRTPLPGGARETGPPSSRGRAEPSRLVDENGYTPGGFDIPPMLGGYEVLQPITAETAWTTHLGRHVALDRQVAIKFLSPMYRSRGSYARRFHREARALSAISHPNVVTLYDYGDLRGLLYMILEFVPGENVLELMRERGALPLERALRIARQVLRGLACAHDRGIVHRDLRPEILLLTPTDQVKIGQFRLASLSYLDPTTSGIETNSLRTFAFLAPEQCMASGAAVDHRCDLYAAGALLFQLLTGREPFPITNPVQLLETKLRPPPDPREIAPAVPSSVATAVRRLLEPEVDRRLPDARAALAALDLGPGEDPAEDEDETPPPCVNRDGPGALELVLAAQNRHYTLLLHPGRTVTIGRSSARSDQAIPDARMSRQHCELVLRETGGVWVKDLKTVNGTRVNGAAVGEQPVQVFAGDLLQLGDTVLEVRATGRAQALLRRRP